MAHPEGLRLVDLLTGHIQQYDSERRSYWTHNPDLSEEEKRENRAYVDLMDDLAEAMLKAELVDFEPSPAYASLGLQPQQVAEFSGELRELILEKLQIEIAEGFSWDLNEAAERALEIGGLVLEHSFGGRVARYLNRVARCYVAGFFPESTILCRSVLETALSEKFIQSGMTPPMRLQEKIKLAKKETFLTDDEAKKAHDIRIRGNKAVHHDPDAVKQHLLNISSLMDVLSSLFSD